MTPSPPSSPSSSLEGFPARTTYSRAIKTITDADVRCQGLRAGDRTCRKLLAELVGRPWVLRCPRCGQVNTSPPL